VVRPLLDAIQLSRRRIEIAFRISTLDLEFEKPHFTV
jgi:hypothetical protein